MKKLIINLIIIMSFFVLSNGVNAALSDPSTSQTVNYNLGAFSVGETKRISDSAAIGNSEYHLDVEVCKYYLDNNHSTGGDFVIMRIDGGCYVTSFVNDEDLLVSYDDYWTQGVLQEQTDHYPATGIGNFLDQENLSLKRIVYEINKGELASDFISAYNLKYIKAASIGDVLVIQYAPRNGTMTTLKLTYSKTGSNSKLQSSEVVVSDITTNVLEQFPFWILHAANKDTDTALEGITLNERLAAFIDITNYKYTKTGNTYNVSATIPDDINAKVKAVYSTFLQDTPLGNDIEPAASNEGQSNTGGQTNATGSSNSKSTGASTTKKTVKNPKTGAFLNLKIVIIGFIITFIGGFLIFRYSKIKKV